MAKTKKGIFLEPADYTIDVNTGYTPAAHLTSVAKEGSKSLFRNIPYVATPRIQRIKLPDIGKIDTEGIKAEAAQTSFQPNIQAGEVATYFDPEQLREDIYSGLRSRIMEERDLAQKRLQETMAKTGLFRSGLTLANQQELEKNALQALGQAWGEAAYKVAGLQTDIAKTQAALETQTNIRNAEIKADLDKFNAQLRTQVNLENAKNMLQAKIVEYEAKKEMAIEQGKLDLAVELANAQNNLKAQLANLETRRAYQLSSFDALMKAAATDQEAINRAREFNITIKNAYDELAFKWAASLLDQEIREYAAKLDLIAKAQAANAQFGTPEAKTQWNTLAYQYAQPSVINTLEAPAYSNITADLMNQIAELRNQITELRKENEELRNRQVGLFSRPFGIYGFV